MSTNEFEQVPEAALLPPGRNLTVLTIVRFVKMADGSVAEFLERREVFQDFNPEPRSDDCGSTTSSASAMPPTPVSEPPSTPRSCVATATTPVSALPTASNEAVGQPSTPLPSAATTASAISTQSTASTPSGDPQRGQKRKRRTSWTSDDVKELLQAVDKYGRRHWKDIAADTSFNLGRKFTTIEIRDKYRYAGKKSVDNSH